jgi:transcriptional regulator with XRE-family HTH domain
MKERGHGARTRRAAHNAVRQLAEQARQLREAMGLSQHDLAAISGVSQPAISRLERGADIPASALLAVAGALEAARWVFVVQRQLPERRLPLPLTIDRLGLLFDRLVDRASPALERVGAAARGLSVRELARG